jgi:hypothetical protein
VHTTLPDEELRSLDRLAHTATGYLVVASLASLIGAYVLAGSQTDASGCLANLPSNILFGFCGSAVAALTSCLDRYATDLRKKMGRFFRRVLKRDKASSTVDSHVGSLFGHFSER